LPAASAKPAKQIGSAGTGQLPTTSGRQKRRRRTNPRKPRPLTPKESEAVHLVGEHKGKVAAAAKVAGKSRQAMQKLYDKAMKKLGKSVFRHATQAIPSDLRGQSTIPDERN
jgi:predicted DNA-binding protein (UPF0251 family)